MTELTSEALAAQVAAHRAAVKKAHEERLHRLQLIIEPAQRLGLIITLPILPQPGDDTRARSSVRWAVVAGIVSVVCVWGFVAAAMCKDWRQLFVAVTFVVGFISSVTTVAMAIDAVRWPRRPRTQCIDLDESVIFDDHDGRPTRLESYLSRYPEDVLAAAVFDALVEAATEVEVERLLADATKEADDDSR